MRQRTFARPHADSISVLEHQGLPGGTVTFLFSDVEGSTARWNRFPEAMQSALAEHDAALRTIITQSGGIIFKTVGDAFCAVFELPQAAVNAALEIQRTLEQLDFSSVGGLRVRVCLHTGTAQERDGDYFGPQVNRAARLLACAHGGQTVLSATTAELVRESLGQDARLIELGTHRLKDLPSPEVIFQLCAEGLSAEFPPLRALVVHHNLPEELTSFVARDESKQLLELLGTHRLVTLAGPGGIGKTRLAVHAGRRVVDTEHRSVWFVDLATLMQSSALPDAIASACELRLPARVDSYTALCNALHAMRALIILDNCEHLVDAAARVASTLLRSCPHLQLLVTSRQPLGIAGEAVLRLPSLTPEQSVELFAERATSADARFSLTAANRKTVEQICARLDGIALAIELAAARVRTLSLERILQLLEERFRILTSNNRDSLPRQQTMRALIAWSYELLTQREQVLFRRLAIFTGGWRLEAAEQICGPDMEGEVLDVLSSLVEKSLVTADVDNDRYRLLESMRTYAGEKLKEFGEMQLMLARHALWAAQFTHARPENREDLLLEGDNIRAALSWCIEEHHDVPLGAQTIVDAQPLWRELESEGIRFASAALDELDEQEFPALCGRLQRMMATFHGGHVRVAHARRAISLLEPLDDPLELAMAYRSLATGLTQIGEGEPALAAARQAVSILENAGLRESVTYAQSLMAVSSALMFCGQSDKQFLLRPVAILESLGETEHAAAAKINLAEFEFRNGAITAAERLVTEAAEATNTTHVHSNALINRGAYRIALRRLDAAASDLRAGIRQAHQHGFTAYVNYALQHAAALAALNGESDRAAKLWGYVNAWVLREGMAREATEAYTCDLLLEVLERRRSAEELQRLTGIGSRMSYDEAVALFGAL